MSFIDKLPALPSGRGDTLPALRTATGRATAAGASRGPGTGGPVGHYLELFRQNLRLVALITVAAGLLATLFAVYKLATNPVYIAAATVTVQPTEAELRFTQSYVRSSPYDSANVVTQSHMEYLRSHEVAARVYRTLVDRASGAPQATPKPPLVAALSQVKRSVRGALHWMNSGRFVELEGPEAVIADIQDATSVSMIESSFIMRISVGWNDPETAASIANILAQAYQERASEQTGAATDEMTGFLRDRRAEAEAALEARRSELTELRSDLGIVDLGSQRQSLIARLSNERERLDSDRADLTATRTQLAEVSDEDTGLRRSGLDDVTRDELSRARLREIELQESVATRDRIVVDLETQLSRLASVEAPLEAKQEEILQARERLSDIDQRLLTTELNQSEGRETLRPIDPARPPLYPAEPKVLKRAMMGTAAGLVLALMLVVARDLLGGRMTTTADLAGSGGLTVLGEARIPAQGLSGAGVTDDVPYMGFAGFDTDDPVLVLDLAQTDRAIAMAGAIAESYPYNPDIHAGRASGVRHAGDLPAGLGLIVLTTGRGESTPDDLIRAETRLAAMAPGVEIATAYVTLLPAGRERG
ncbi:hypothetical protein EKE94_05980 [Mesobaculum littorinae]|uniref:Polysaccharide chain length determinant N-terminal domain-containing protein n=1 Tax=Mesobaculum littorinae TaxID=2486419 RepID=A0A438AIP4_9RHOB|nr:hypothetical protein [Mesobaculum littorinae]RVV98467.1 hypothetical protein EKE94_05980 [Mesobaculum littorinae]